MTTHDQGLLVRLTPYDSIDHEGLLPGFDRAIAPLASGLRVDLSFGLSWINDAEETIDFTDGDSDPVARVERSGIGLRVAMGLPSSVEDDLAARDVSWLATALTPILSVGLAWDEEKDTYQGADGNELEGLKFGAKGVEVTLFNVFSIRSGEYEVPEEQGRVESRNTWGYGLGFHVPELGGVYFDRGEVSLGNLFTNNEPTAFGCWVDPAGLWRALH